MVQLQFDVLDSKCWSRAGRARVLLRGLMLVYFTTLSSRIHASPATCSSSKYQHCGFHPAGVHGLDCFRRFPDFVRTECVWKPGNHTSDKEYTIVVDQPPIKCKPENITTLSKTLKVSESRNLTVEVFENINSRNCTKAVFRGLPRYMVRCGPPVNVSFGRHSGGLDVNVTWPPSHVKGFTDYHVRYKEQGNSTWDESPLQFHKGNRCRVENLNSSLAYVVQIRCVTNTKCTQCPWSEAYYIPSELRTQPDSVDLQDTDVPQKNGRRLVSVSWKFSADELNDGYSVTVRKTSGETPVNTPQFNTSQPQIRLILSYSAYHLHISAVNNVSISPAARLTIPQREDMSGMRDGRLKVKVQSNRSFTISWKDNLIRTYVCYSVEWRKEGDKVKYMSFYQRAQNNRTLDPLPEPLEPYQRYNITLHTRPEKGTCNMKHINNSESTYGSTQFYFTEGTPLSAPKNIQSYNGTLTSVVLEWLPIPEEDTRGFLLGYIIYYTEYHQRRTGSEKNVTVDPELNIYGLEGLKSATTYQVQISGFTSAGEGVRSEEILFKTEHEGNFDVKGIIIIFSVVALVLICGTPIIKRAKVVLWPSIPSPGYSNAMQKIDGICELELLEAIKTLKVEEWDTKSLQIVEKEAVIPASALPSMLPLLSDSLDEGDSTDTSRDWFQTDTDNTSGDVLPHDTSSDTRQMALQGSPFVFPSGYTTLEMLQQVIPQGMPLMNTTEVIESESEDADFTVVKSGVEYVRQFSTSPIMDSEQMSTIL
ncbi:interleukin-6 receptor subunit beta isoform X2 [Mugil cephalus]|uniref:interleukin-6 receptor subunit beta isoform X2 n=1 Tax=Mugil cephalus TaxID=48193 RepID=UPI001FB6EABF|nr:interleukin-6 receptor subunit beta isoform X2 [Mugil cephalus]